MFWNISSILYRVRVQLDAAPIMLISGKSINDNDVAAASHRISRLLHPSRTLVTISCSTINGALRGNAPRPHTHLTSAQVSKPRGVWTKTQTNCQCGQALLGTRERRGKHGDSRSQDTQGGRDYTSATTGIRHIGRSDSNNDSRSAQGVRNAPMQPTVLVFPPGTSCEGVNSRTMRARRQPRRQGSLAATGTHEWRTRTGRAACATTCIGTKTSRSPVQLCRGIGGFHGEVGHHLGGI